MSPYQSEDGHEKEVQRRADNWFLNEAAAGKPIKELSREHGFSDASFYLWRKKYGGMDVAEAKRLKKLEAENAKLKRMLAESMLDNDALKLIVQGKV